MLQCAFATAQECVHIHVLSQGSARNLSGCCNSCSCLKTYQADVDKVMKICFVSSPVIFLLSLACNSVAVYAKEEYIFISLYIVSTILTSGKSDQENRSSAAQQILMVPKNVSFCLNQYKNRNSEIISGKNSPNILI